MLNRILDVSTSSNDLNNMVKIKLQDFALTKQQIKTLSRYVEFIKIWQKKMNLISNNSVGDIWERHILDCLQLVNYIDLQNKKIFDFGSGAGLPGIVLAIIVSQNRFFLFESITKKAMFLTEIKHLLKLENVEIINERIELSSTKNKADFIVSRALCKLNLLLLYIKPLLKIGGMAILLKGKSYQEELTNAKELLNSYYSYEIKPNLFSESGKILIIKRIK